MKVLFPTNFIPGRLRSLTASLLCVTLLLSDLPAHAQTPAQPLPQNPVLIPAEYGRVEEVRQAGSKTIFFLQDAHDSLEAQENIAALIRHLVETSGVKTVFEEGYEGPVPADDYFGRFKDSEVREKVSYYLLDQLRIGGAEYAHINRKRSFKLIGGDDAELHRENIAWYRKTAEHQEEASQGLVVLQQEIARLADRNFPAGLKEWMKLKARFDQGKISFWDYLQRLREPGAAFFHDGIPTEAMSSRYPVLSRLYRAAMKDLSQELQDGDVNAEILFRETSDFENDIADTLITVERDRQTFTFYKTLGLLLRLNSLEVSYDEYHALKGTLPEAATEDFARFISLHANRSVSLSKRWEENIQNAMQFYETAGERDRAVEKKLIEFKADTKEPSAVLVFGGFHRSAIREILRRQGFSYQIISPVIAETQEKHRERYRNLMAADYETRFVPASVSAASRALSDIAVAELSPVYKRRFAEELDLLSWAARNTRGGPGGDVLLDMQQELNKQPATLRSELRAEDKFQRGERLTQEKLEEEVRKLGETSLEVGGNDRTGWAVSTEKRYEHDRLHALESALSKRFKGYRFSYYYDVRTDQDFKRLDILPPLSRRSELRPGLKSVDAEVLPRESEVTQAAASGLSSRSELRGVSGSLLGAAVFENPLWLLAVPPALAAAVYFLYQAYHFWISKRIASALAQGARYIARGSYTHVLKHAGFTGYVILVKRHPFVMKLKQGEAIRSPQVTEKDEWQVYKALNKLGLAPFTRYTGKFPMKNMHPEWAGAEGEDVFRADQKKLAEMHGKISSSMMGVSVYIQEEGVPLNQFVRENPDQKSLADKSLASFTLKLWNAGWIDLDIGRRNYLLVTDREGHPLKTSDGLFRLKAHDFGAIMPIPEDLERFMISKHMDSDVTRGFFLLRNLTATVRAAAILFPKLDLKAFHNISKAADEAAERMKARGDKAAFRSAYLGVIESPENKKVITELSIDAARMIRKAVEEGARSELRSEDAGEAKERKRIKQRVRAEAEKRVLAARKVLRTRIIFIGFASAALLAGGMVYWMLPNVPAQPEAAAPSEAVIERQRFATIRGIPITDSTKDILSQQSELIDAIAEGYDAADRVRKSQIAGYQLSEGQAPLEDGQIPGVVFQVQPHTPLDVAPPFEPVQIRRDAAGRLSPVDLQGVRNSVSGGRIQTVEQVREWMAWLPLAAVGLMAVLAYAFLKGVRRVDTGSIMDVKSASDRTSRDIARLRAAAEKKRQDNEDGGARSELRSNDRQINVYHVIDDKGQEIGVYRKRIPKDVFSKLDNVTVRGFKVSDAVRMGERSWYYVNARNDLMGVPAEARVEKGLVTELKFLKPEGEEVHTFSRIYTRDDAGERQLTDVFPFELTPKKLKTLEKATVTQYRLDKIGSLMIGGRHWARFPKYPNASVEVDIDQGLITNTRIVNDQGTVLEEFPMMTVWNSEGKLEEVFYEKITSARLAKLNRVTLKGLVLSKSTGQLQIGGGRHWTSLEKHKGARVEVDFEEGLVVTIRVLDGKGKVRATYPMGRIYKDGKLIDVYHRQMTPKKFKTLDGVVIKTRLDPRGAMTLGDRNWVVLKNYKLFPIEADVKQGFVTEVRVLDPKGAVLKAFPFYQVHDESGRIVEVFPSRFTPHKKEKLKKPGAETSGEANRATKVVKGGEVFPAEGPWKNISKKDLIETQQGVLKGLALGRTSGALRVGGRRWIALTQYRGYAAEADIESGRVVTVRVLDPEGEVIKTVELPRVYENGQFVDVMRHGHQNKLDILARDVTIKKLRLTKDGVLFFANQYWGVFSDHRRAPIEIDIKDKRIVEVRISNPDGSVLEIHKAKRILNMKGEVVSVFYGTVLPAQLKKMGKVRVEGLKFNGSGTLLFGGARIYSDSNFPNASADIVYDASEGKVHEVHVVKDGEGNPVDYLYRGSDLTQKRSRMEYYSERGHVFEAALKWTLEILGEPFEYQKHFHEDAWDEPEATGHVPDFTNTAGEIFANETLHYIDAKFNMLFGSSLDEYLPIIRGRLQKEWQVDVENPSSDDFVKKVIFELVYLGSNQEAKLDQKIAKFKETFSAAHPEILDIRVTSFWDAYAPRLEAAGRHDLVEFLQVLKNFHYKKGRSSMLAAFRRQLMEKKAPQVREPVSTQAELFSIDAESSVEERRDPGPRSELRAQPQGDVFAGLKASLLKLMTAESTEEKNAIFNSVARSLTKANSSVKGKFRRVLLELLDNRLEERALWAIGSRERETSAGQRAVYRRLHEHLYDERGSLRKDIMKLETAPSAAATLKYEDAFTVRAGRRKETLRVERLTSLSQSDWSQIFEIYGPHNLREFHRDLMSGRRNLSGKENAVFVVRSSENKIAGFSWAFADPGKKMLGLAVSGVAKPYRGKGLAARLLISRLEWGVSNGLTYARTHVGGSGRINGWHWRLLSLGGRIDSLSLQSPLPEIGIRPEEQSSADQAIRAAQSKPYPQSRKPVESVLKKHPDADVVVTFDLSSRLLGSMKGKVLAENLRSELRTSEPDSWQPLQEQMDHLLRLYPTEEGESFYDLTDEKGFFRALRELLRQYQKAEESLRSAQPEARSQFESFQKSLEVLLARLELLLDEDYSKLTEFHPGAAAATFGVMAVQIKPEILQDETPRQFFFGLFSLKQLTESGVLKVDLFDGAVVSPLPEVKGVLADRYPEVMREKLEKIQKLTVSFLEDFQGSRSELRTGETNLQHFVNSIISSHRWPDIIEVDIDSSLRIKETSTSHLGFAIFELVKNAIDGNRVYEKKSGTDSRPDVRLTAAKKDGWIEFRIMNRGVLAVDKLRAQAREDGVWKLLPSTPDKHLWPYLYIMESRMPEEPMPYQRMRPEEVDALADEDLLFHVKGLTLRSDKNLRRIGLMRSDLTGGMGLGLKLVWQEMKTVDPERPVHYETSEIDGTPWVTFSVRLPEAAPRSELRNLEGPAPALETADFFLKRLGTLSGISSAAYSRLDLNPEGQRFFFETLKTTLAASFGEEMNGFTEKDVARTAYAVRDDKSGVPLGVLYQFGTLPIFFDFIELTKPPTEAALLNRDHAGAWAAADQTARRVYQKKLGQVHFLERLTLAGLSSESSRWLTEHERLHEKVSSGLLSLFVISEIQDWSRKADIFLRPDQVGSLDFQQSFFRINRQRPEFFKSIVGITGFGTGVDSLLAIRYGAEAIHGTEPYALVRLLGELNIRYARESGQISAELPVTVEMTKGLSKDSAVRTWFFNTPLVVKNGTRSTFMPANVRLPIALLPSTGSLYLEESEFQAILKEAASMLAGQPGKRAVMRVDGDFFTTPKEDMTAYLESVRIYLEKFGLSLTGYYGGAFVEFQAAAYGLEGKEQYLKSAFKILEEDGQPSVPAEALLWFIRQLESAAVTAADGGTVPRDPLEAWKKKLLENPARSELRTPSDAEYIQIAAEAERLRELVEDHSLLRNKPDGTGKSDIVKALAEARDLSRERGDIERIVEIVKRANGWYPGRVNTNYFQFDDRNIKKQLAAFSRSVQKTLRDSNAGRSELRMFINDLVRQQFVIAGVPFLDEHIPTDKGVFRPTLSGLVDPLAEYAGHYEPVRVIDLGSGQGAMVFAFARANDRAEVLGIEYDEQLFNDSVKVRDSFFEDTRKRIRLERGDFNDPRFAEEIQKADLVNYWETGARAEGTMLLNLAKNMRAGARFLVTKNSGRFIRAVKDTGYFDLAEEALDDGIFLFKRNEKPFEALAAAKPEDRSELRMSGSGEFSLSPAVEKMTVPAAVFLDARELPQLKAGQADERFDELLTFLERHPAFDLYIDHGDQYPLHNLELPKLRQILSEFPGRVHFGEHSRANLAKKKILLQVSFFEDAGSFAETRKLIQDIQRRYRIQSDLLPVEYLLPGSLKGFLGLAESFTQAEMIREIGEAYATRSTGGRWRLAADFAASLWARIQNDYAIQWSA